MSDEQSAAGGGRGRALPVMILAGLLLLVSVEGFTCGVRRSEQARALAEISAAMDHLEEDPRERGAEEARRSGPILGHQELLLLRAGAGVVEFFLGGVAVILGVLGLRRSARASSLSRQRSLVGLIGGVVLVAAAGYLILGLVVAVGIAAGLR